MYTHVLVALLVVVGVSSAEVCSKVSSIDISNGTLLSNEAILFEGLTYNKNEYFMDNETNTARGCICKKRTCARKCCPFGYGVNSDSRLCEPVTDEFYPPVWDEYKLLDEANALEMFHFIIYRFCPPSTRRLRVGESANGYHLRHDGTLYVSALKEIPPWRLKDIEHYCIDTFITEDSHGIKTTTIDAFQCFSAKQEDRSYYAVSSSCMLISCVFILITVTVYAWLPELRNLHGRVLMTYLLCLFVGFLFMSTMQILLYHYNISTLCCISFSFIIYFALQSAFFWLNVMCFDIWWTFSGNRGVSLKKLSTRARFIAYSMYAFGIPTALTILLAILEFSDLPGHPLLPMIRHQGCFLYGHTKLIYLYGPIVILIVANIAFFILTMVKIAQIKKQTSVLKSKESSTHDPHGKDKQRLVLYLKLFAVMGINWILEVISAVYPKAEGFWHYTDAYNVLIGVTIFIVFVCKRKMFRLIKKRLEVKGKRTQRHTTPGKEFQKYKQVRGDPMSRTVTSTSTRTISIREDVKMGSIKVR